MQMNLQNIIQMLKSGNTPQQIVMNYFGNQLNNPMASNLLSLAQKGDYNSVEQIARNLCASKGVDFDKEFTDFKNLLGR